MQARVTTPASVPVSELFRSRREGKTQRTMLVKLKTQIFIVLQVGGGGGVAVSLRMKVWVTGQHDWQQF